MLNITFERLMSLLIYSQDWNAVEGLITLLHNSNLMSKKVWLECMSNPGKNYVKKLASVTSLRNVKNLDELLLWSTRHALTSGNFEDDF